MKTKINYFISFLLISIILISLVPNQNNFDRSANDALSIQLADNGFLNNFQIEKKAKNKVPANTVFADAVDQEFNQKVLNSQRIVKSNTPSILRELSFHTHLTSLFSTDT